jgi:site-specific DNA-cytosine methylase
MDRQSSERCKEARISEFTHASIVPLIGGESLGSERAFGTRPDYLLSFEPFWANDRHLANYWPDTPYIVLDKGGKVPHKVDVVSTVCPCAGLSMLSHGYGDDNPNNRWMENVTKFVLEDMRPKVYWGENAPGFAGKVGTPVRDRLFKTGVDNGYTMTVYRTKSALHGLGQVRERAFYFFWDTRYFGPAKTPLLRYFNRQPELIQDTILNAKGNFQSDPINPKTPSVDDPVYRYVLEEIHGGMSHREFFEQMLVDPGSTGRDVQYYAQYTKGRSPAETAAWLQSNGYEREAKSFRRRQEKMDAGLNVMYRRTIVPKGSIGAFVNPSQLSITHPHEDRYINYREALAIMGMPLDFELLDPKHSHNHICQNVPVQTAADMAGEVKAALMGRREHAYGELVFQQNHSRSHRVEGRSVSLETFFHG